MTKTKSRIDVPHRLRNVLPVSLLILVSVGWLAAEDDSKFNSSATSRLDPAAWGGDHIGQPWPAYVTGDECLFCHRQIGTTWPDNRHQRTVRPANAGDPTIESLRNSAGNGSFANATTHLLGGPGVTRYLKRSDQYGMLELLMRYRQAPTATPPETPEEDVPVNRNAIHWDDKVFGDRCAGCHATAVDATSLAFSSLSLDCFVCHGDVDLAHTKDPQTVLLSAVNRDPRQIISLCGQCHLRGGKSKTSGRPYPHTFVAGDNLFRDFQVDLGAAAIEKLPAIDQHIFANTRDVVLMGNGKTTCLSCHDIHGQTSQKHQQLDSAMICSSCHGPDPADGNLRETYRILRKRPRRSSVCDY